MDYAFAVIIGENPIAATFLKIQIKRYTKNFSGGVIS